MKKTREEKNEEKKQRLKSQYVETKRRVLRELDWEDMLLERVNRNCFVVHTKLLKNVGIDRGEGCYSMGNEDARFHWKGTLTYVVSDMGRVEDAVAFVLENFCFALGSRNKQVRPVSPLDAVTTKDTFHTCILVSPKHGTEMKSLTRPPHAGWGDEKENRYFTPSFCGLFSNNWGVFNNAWPGYCGDD